MKITVPNMFLYLSFLETSQAQLSSYAHLHGNYLQLLQIQIKNLIIFTKRKHSAFLKSTKINLVGINTVAMVTFVDVARADL